MANQIIDALGGTKALAEALGVSANVVGNWRLPDRGIPWKRRHAIARLAAERGVRLPDDFWNEEAA